MTLSFEKLDCDNIVRDDKGRVIVRQRGSRIAIARFPDMSKTIKKYVAGVYSDITGEDENKAMDFLNYNTDEISFCS